MSKDDLLMLRTYYNIIKSEATKHFNQYINLSDNDISPIAFVSFLETTYPDLLTEYQKYQKNS